ncbi:MAG: tetratricopeptide repeat protein, partial [Pyrinomonadaceae bacterium]|nr:tetratricopeptide repeat protein [Pyrinomonadaceae bacterium]
QDALSNKIARTLFFELSNTEKKQLARRQTENVEAYEKYLRGRFYQNQNTEQGLTKAVEFYEQAIALDRGFADAYAGLADALLILYNFGLRPPDEIVPRAKQSINRALQLNPNLSDAYSALALIQFLSERDWLAAEKSLQKAIELNPNNADIYLRYGYFLTANGKFEDALAKLEKARQLNPLSPIVQADIGLTYLCARRYGQAIEQLEKVVAENPEVSLPRWFLGSSYDANEEPEKAFAEYLRALEREGGTELAARLEAVKQSKGEQTAYQIWLEENLKMRNQGYFPAINIAFLYAAMKNREQTLTWLEKAFDEHEPTLWQIKHLPNYDFIRDEARFQEILLRSEK